MAALASTLDDPVDSPSSMPLLGRRIRLALTSITINISPTSLSTTSSAEALLGVIAGGLGTLGGPVVRAALVLLLKNLRLGYYRAMEMLLGLVFLFIVLVCQPESSPA